MKIEKRENVKGSIQTIVTFENKKYVRIQKDKFTGLDMQPIVEWKKQKTNHLVNSRKHNLLEESFITIDKITKKELDYTQTSYGPAKICCSGTTSFHEFKTSPTMIQNYSKKELVDAELKKFFKEGKILNAVKFYKELTGLGLKEAKEYIDAQYSQYIVKVAERKWQSGMELTYAEERDKNAVIEAGKFFERGSDRKKFIADMKRFMKDGNGPLQTVKKMKDITGWGLYVTKIFFDLYIK